MSIIDAHACDSVNHGPTRVFATRRLFWVTGPVEYCDHCATCMQLAAQALGTYVHEEPIPVPEDPVVDRHARAIDL